MTEESKRLAERINKFLDEKLAQDIEIIDVSGKTILTDAFVICSGRTVIQTRALADQLEDTLKKEGINPLNQKEGFAAGRWILLDYGTVVVHIFHKDDREFYSLERLWSGAHPAEPAN